MPTGESSNRNDIWQDYILWSADEKTLFADATQKVLMLGDYSISGFPGSSSSSVAWIVLVDGVHSSMNGKYFILQWYGVGTYAWSGTWALLDLPREFYIDTGLINIVPKYIVPHSTNRQNYLDFVLLQ